MGETRRGHLQESGLRKVDGRRLRRRLKAGAAVALAMVAGAFLACKGESSQPEPPSPSGPDARSGPGSRVAEDAGNADATNNAADAEQDAGQDAAIDAENDAPSDALAIRDGSAPLVVRDGGPPRGQDGAPQRNAGAR